VTTASAASTNNDTLPQKQAVYTYSSRTADKFVVRFPDGMRERIAQLARVNHRSMNSEIVSCLNLHIRLEDLGLMEYVKQLANGQIVPEGVNVDSSALAAAREANTGEEVAQFRAGDPVMFGGTPWIIAKLTVRSGNVYAKLEREDPSDASKTDDTEARYSALKPFMV
jgi:hypothetical protein